MATPAETCLPQPSSFQPSPFLNRLVLFLLPHFLAITSDYDIARAEILETLVSYGARTRSEMISAARIIAFSFSALDMLAETKAAEMPPTMRLRFSGCANGLNRSCQQAEQGLAKSLACDLPDAVEPSAEPVDDIPDAEVQEMLQQVCARLSSKPRTARSG